MLAGWLQCGLAVSIWNAGEMLDDNRSRLGNSPMKARFWFVMFLAVFLVPDDAVARYAPRVGKLHPDFTLPNIGNGKPVRLSQFRGKKVLLVHFASW
jgi:hypothetical protein